MHGATKALKTWRISFDFRIIIKDEYDLLNENLKKFIVKWNNSIDICNLLICSDYIGASEKMQKLSVSEKSILCDELARVYMLRSPESEFMKKYSKFYWQDEFNWLLESI